MPKFRKKPVEIEAVQWRPGDLQAPLPTWWHVAVNKMEGDPGSIYRDDDNLYIYTLEGSMCAMPNDWIIRGVRGELYPCKPDIFAATYDPV